jgi:hypothetical protein
MTMLDVGCTHHEKQNKLVHHSFRYQDLYMLRNVIPAEAGILNYLDRKKGSSI